MLRSVLLSAVFLGGFAFSLPVSAQQTESAVVSVCRDVVLEEIRVGGRVHPLAGFCVEAVGNYLRAVERASSVEALNAAIADLVAALAELLLTPQCVLDSEIVEATLLARGTSTDPFQQEQLLLIADTLNSCDLVITAAITATNFGPSLSDNSQSGGNSASPN